MNRFKFISLAGLVAVVLLVSACNTLPTYAVKVGDSTVTSDDFLKYEKVLEKLNAGSGQSYLGRDGAIAVAPYAASRLSQLANADLYGQLLDKRGLHITPAQYQSFAELVATGSIGNAFNQLSTSNQKKLIEVNLLPQLYAAAANGANAKTKATIVCVKELAFQTQQDAQDALNKSKTAQNIAAGNGGVNPADNCFVEEKSGTLGVQTATNGVALNSFVGPYVVSGQQGNEYHIAFVESRRVLAFPDWPVSALDTYQSQKPIDTKALGRELRSLAIKVNPQYGTLTTDPNEVSQLCSATAVICIKAPENRLPTTTTLQSPQQLSPFGQ